jgi:hypothetical protein
MPTQPAQHIEEAEGSRAERTGVGGAQVDEKARWPKLGV